MRRTLQVLLPIGLLATGALIAAVLFLTRREAPAGTPARAVPAVRYRVLDSQTVRAIVKSQGTVVPRTESALVAQVAGTITDISDAWADGGFFEQGDVLLELDARDHELAREQARLALRQAELRLAREEEEAAIARREWEKLGKTSVESRAPSELLLRKPQLAEARAAVAAARAALERAELDIERTRIRAPYAGRIREVRASLGQFVGTGAVLAQVYAVDYAEIRLPVPDSELEFVDLPLAYRGDSDDVYRPEPEVLITARFAGSQAGPWRGKVVRTEGEIDPRTRMIYAIARVEDPYGRTAARLPPLAVGLFVEAEIRGKTLEGVASLPRHALRKGDRVLVVETSRREEAAEDASPGSDGGTVHRLYHREVRVVRRQDDEVLIDLRASGLADGDRVITSPLEIVADGMEVRLAQAEERR